MAPTKCSTCSPSVPLVRQSSSRREDSSTVAVGINGELDDKNGPSSEEQQWKRRSIYKISSRITGLNKNAYEPEVVSFGPYHHEKDHLKAMEEHKQRARRHFLSRCNKSIDHVFHRMEQVEVVQKLKDSYEPLHSSWTQDTRRFLEVMILDGCFMLEIVRASDRFDQNPSDRAPREHEYPKNDPVFSEHGKLNVMPYVKRDMLLLENQLPMLVLRTLIEVESDRPSQVYDLFKKQILKFLSPTIAETEATNECVHVLELYRKNLIGEGPSDQKNLVREGPSDPKSSCISGCFGRFLENKEPKHGFTDAIIRSATELHNAGIWFRKSKTQSLRDVTFSCGILKLPIMVVDDTSESILLNIIAFERLHVGAGNGVTSYVYFMNTIIDDEKDVALLHRRGILVKALGCPNDIAKLFNSLAKDVTPDQQRESNMAKVIADLSKYCKKRCRRWRAIFVHTYCRNPWVATSVFAAIFLFALTIIQTVYSVASYYDP